MYAVARKFCLALPGCCLAKHANLFYLPCGDKPKEPNFVFWPNILVLVSAKMLLQKLALQQKDLLSVIFHLGQNYPSLGQNLPLSANNSQDILGEIPHFGPTLYFFWPKNLLLVSFHSSCFLSVGFGFWPKLQFLKCPLSVLAKTFSVDLYREYDGSININMNFGRAGPGRLICFAPLSSRRTAALSVRSAKVEVK